MRERLQKILAEGGFGSRRECENLILEGRVEVDRQVVLQMGTKVDPEEQSIRVDGQKLKPVFKRYFAVNKPRGVVSTNKDPSGRPRVVDLIPTDQRVYTVGRLDKDSEGLIIVTNDGDLANRLTHPRYGIEKTYMIQVEGHPTREQMDALVAGVHLAEGFVQIKHFQFKSKQRHTTEIEIVLDEGRNREVRRLLAKIGHKVLFLRRVAIGSFELEGIPFGGNRRLDASDVKLLGVNPRRRQPKAKGKTGPGSKTKKDATQKKFSKRYQGDSKKRVGGKKKSVASAPAKRKRGKKKTSPSSADSSRVRSRKKPSPGKPSPGKPSRGKKSRGAKSTSQNKRVSSPNKRSSRGRKK